MSLDGITFLLIWLISVVLNYLYNKDVSNFCATNNHIILISSSYFLWFIYCSIREREKESISTIIKQSKLEFYDFQYVYQIDYQNYRPKSMTLDQYQRGQIKGYNVLGSTNNRHLGWISDLRQCSQPAHTSQYQHATCISTQVRYALDMFIWAVCICICVRMHPPFNDGNGECINKRKFRILLALQSATQPKPRVIHFHLYDVISMIMIIACHYYRLKLSSHSPCARPRYRIKFRGREAIQIEIKL